MSSGSEEAGAAGGAGAPGSAGGVGSEKRPEEAARAEKSEQLMEDINTSDEQINVILKETQTMKLEAGEQAKEDKKSDIPRSVSKALFSQGLKVTKVRDNGNSPKFIGLKQPQDPESIKRFNDLQKTNNELTKKIKKVEIEINYLKDLIENANVTTDLSELKKLEFAIDKLKQYLDVKEKEKYEIGIQLTRAVRKRVDSGELGEFWST